VLLVAPGWKDHASKGVLDALKPIYSGSREGVEKGITVVEFGIYESVGKYGGRVGVK